MAARARSAVSMSARHIGLRAVARARSAGSSSARTHKRGWRRARASSAIRAGAPDADAGAPEVGRQAAATSTSASAKRMPLHIYCRDEGRDLAHAGGVGDGRGAGGMATAVQELGAAAGPLSKPGVAGA